MTSYRTLLFGTIAVIAAAAPAMPAQADSLAAVPLASVRAPQDSLAAVPLARQRTSTASHPSFVDSLMETFVRFEEMVLRITL